MNMHTGKNIWNQRKEICNCATEICLRRRNVEISQRAGYTKLSCYVREDDTLVEGVTHSQYLGMIMEDTDSEW